MKSFLFVCTGNICRSPLAQAVFEDYIKKENIEDIFADSCALEHWEIGKNADYRSIQVAKKRNIQLNHIARKFEKKDLAKFDYIFAMDDYHYTELRKNASEIEKRKIFYYTHFDKDFQNPYPVKDPYNGIIEDFENTFLIVDKMSKILIEKIKKQEL